MRKISEKQYLNALQIVTMYEAQKETYEINNITPETKLGDIKIQCRGPWTFLWALRHCFKTMEHIPFDCSIIEDVEVKNLRYVSMKQFSECRNIGEKAQKELQRICNIAGVKMLP